MASVRSEETENSYPFAVFSGGEWSEETRRQWGWTETFTRHDGSERRSTHWQVEGFSSSVAEEYGAEYSTRVQVYRADGPGARGFLVELEVGCTCDYVICPKLPDLLALLRDLLPLVSAARDHMEASIRDEHYSTKHWRSVRYGDGDVDCSICQQLMERRSFEAER